MKVRIDFSLGQRFGAVEQTIFRLVLGGFTNTRQISCLLGVFSDVVIANALRRLVNQQIIKADLETQTLAVSDAVMSIIEMCLNTLYDLDMPDSLVDKMPDGNLLITDIATKEAILAQLLPNIKLSFLAKALDFSLSERGELDE
jgi:hypothetical protein